MEPNNTSTYKKQSMTSEFTHSCLGKLVILAGFIVLLLIVALLTVPSDKEMQAQAKGAVSKYFNRFRKKPKPNDAN